jgi:hypothetical protein
MNLFDKAEKENEQDSRAKLLAEQKDYFENSFLPIVNELTELFQGENPQIGKVNQLALKLEKGAGKICVALFSTVNQMKLENDEIKYLKFSYKRFEELYEEYGDENGKINWAKVAEDKGKNFVKTFPLKDAIRAAKMVANGELEI